jgi:hypothetical protein
LILVAELLPDISPGKKTAPPRTFILIHPTGNLLNLKFAGIFHGPAVDDYQVAFC